MKACMTCVLRSVSAMVFVVLVHPAVIVAQDSPEEDPYQRRADHRAFAAAQSSSTAPAPSDEVFIQDTGPDLDRYLYRTANSSATPPHQGPINGNGKLTFDIPITRYYGSHYDNKIQFNPDGTIANWSAVVFTYHLLPAYAKLVLRVYDVDWDCGQVPQWCESPECDLVSVNGVRVQFGAGQSSSGVTDTVCNRYHLPGEHGKWTVAIADVRTDLLKFPQLPGTASTPPTPALNRIEIEIDDIQNPANQWAMACDWGALVIGTGGPSFNFATQGLPMRPFLLVHGGEGNSCLNTSGCTWSEFGSAGPPFNAFRYYGIPFEVPDIPASTSFPWNAGMQPSGTIGHNAVAVGTAIDKTKNIYGVTKVNILAHSKGGLDSRSAAHFRSDVDHLIELSTPNHGIELFDKAYSLLLNCCVYVPFPFNVPWCGLYAYGVVWHPDAFQLQRWYMKNFYNYVLGIPFLPTFRYNPNVQYQVLAATGGIPNFITPWRHDNLVSVRSATLPWKSPAYIPSWGISLTTYPPSSNVDRENITDGAFPGFGFYPPYWGHLRTRKHEDGFRWSINRVTPAFGFPDVPFPPETEPRISPGFATLNVSVSDTTDDDSTQIASGFGHFIAAGQVVSDTVRVADADSVSFALPVWNGRIAVSLIAPDASIIDSTAADSLPNVDYMNLDDTEFPQFVAYSVRAPKSGNWQVRARGIEDGNYVGGLVVMGPARLRLLPDKPRYVANEPLRVRARFRRQGNPLLTASVASTVRWPDSTQSTLTLFDDGSHGDSLANDGIYTNTFAGSAAAGYGAIMVRAQKDSIVRSGSTPFLISPSSAQIVGTYTEQPSDTDGDSLYNSLDIGVRINVISGGHYELSANLTDPSGGIIQQKTFSTLMQRLPPLSPGLQTVTLSFDGRQIYDHGVNGPYKLKAVVLSQDKDSSLPMLVTYVADAYTTSPYALTKFQAPPVFLTDSASISLEDVDHNGKYDYLATTIGVMVARSGLYVLSGQLADSAGVGIQWRFPEDSLTAGLNLVSLKFDGRAITRHAVNGPFVIKNLAINDITHNSVVSFTNVARTAAYPASVFERATFLYSVSHNWNLVSVPFKVDDPRPNSIFPSATSKAFAYDNNLGYTISDTLKSGRGFWLRFASAQNLALLGAPLGDDTVHVQAGWNLIGSLSDPLPVTGVVSQGTSLGHFFGYQGSYYVATSIEPGKGYWVKASSNGDIILSASHTTPKSALEPAEVDLRNFSVLKVKDAREHEQTLRFGNAAGKAVWLDQYDLPPVPPEGGFDVRFTTQRTVAVYSDKMTEPEKLRIEMTSLAYPVTVNWEIGTRTRETILLTDIFGGRAFGTVPLTGKGNAHIENPAITSLVLKITGSREIPKEFALYQCYPDPFNPSTTIRFDLPKDALVTLKVYDVVGREVATLADQQRFEAGVQQIDFNGGSLTSGTYFYRLSARSDGKSFEDVKKMILMK